MLWKLPAAGGTPRAVVTGAPFVQITGVAFHNGTLYVTDNDTSGGPKIYKVQ